MGGKYTICQGQRETQDYTGAWLGGGESSQTQVKLMRTANNNKEVRELKQKEDMRKLTVRVKQELTKIEVS